MTSIITARSVSFELPNGRELFKDLNFTLNSRVSALVGPNGIGKSSLAKLLAGELEPTAGVIRRSGTVAYFPQRELPPPVPLEAFLGGEYAWSLIGECLLEGIDRQALCTTLSGGQWMRARLAGVLESPFLILDEPTNDLDRNGRRAVLDFLRNREGGALLISHDRECLRLCEDILELSSQGLVRFGGGWSAYEEAKEREREALRTALEIAERERDRAVAVSTQQKARQEKRTRRGAQAAARGGMPKILIGARKRRAEVTSGKIDTATLERAQEAVRKAHEAFRQVKVDPEMYAELLAQAMPAQKLVAEARGFNVRFREWIYRQDLNFAWRGNVRIALKGANGSGKSTLIKAITGELPEERGELRGELRRGELVTLYVDQRCESLDDERSVLENIRQVSSASESEIRNALARFLFAKEKVFQKVGNLSGGERLRAALARGFLSAEKPELLVLDEPTNNLDLANIEFLEGLVREFRGALVVISHDEVFLENCGVSQELAL